jgi:hypothetical protein
VKNLTTLLVNFSAIDNGGIGCIYRYVWEARVRV